MSICTQQEILDFLEVSSEYSTINAANNALIIKYNGGVSTTITIADGTYTPTTLASALQTALNTAFTISCTVSFSSTTHKYTLTAPVAQTFTYVHANSTAASIFGFSQDHAAVNAINSDNASSSPTSIISVLQTAVEKWISKICRRTFETTNYTFERYSGKGTPYLFLKNYPVTTLIRLAIGTRDMIRVRNTANNTMATVSVSSTGVILVRDDVVDATLLFADYTTLSALVAAIGAVGNSWQVAISSELYNNYKSSFLMPMYGAWCNYGVWTYLNQPNEGIDDFELIAERGVIKRSKYLFPKGNNNVIVNYTAGYTADNMPDLLKDAVKIFTKVLYQKFMQESWNISEYQIGLRDVVQTYTSTNGVPAEVSSILGYYKRNLVG